MVQYYHPTVHTQTCTHLKKKMQLDWFHLYNVQVFSSSSFYSSTSSSSAVAAAAADGDPSSSFSSLFCLFVCLF